MVPYLTNNKSRSSFQFQTFPLNIIPHQSFRTNSKNVFCAFNYPNPTEMKAFSFPPITVGAVAYQKQTLLITPVNEEITETHKT